MVVLTELCKSHSPRHGDLELFPAIICNMLKLLVLLQDGIVILDRISRKLAFELLKQGQGMRLASSIDS